ncbi:MAG: hypothetical protein ACLFSL_04165 [Candidatus Woesearchaeota archaeon]
MDFYSELESRFKKDQKLCRKDEREFLENCHKNSEWLKKIIIEEGWLSSDKVGKQGELYAWLIVQHSDDIEERIRSIITKNS